MIQRLMVPLACRSLLVSMIFAAIAILLITPISLLHGDQPMSATLREVSAGVTWSGNTLASTAAFDPVSCQKSGTCDVFALDVNISDQYRHKNPNFSIIIHTDWDNLADDYDLFVYRDDEMVAKSTHGQTDSEEIALVRPPNGDYHIFMHSAATMPLSRYVGRAHILPYTVPAL